uniref:Fat-body protein 1 n=1 Tax=Ceratitis capitata TaxID=7213 RepID=W8B9V1_CERCA
MKSFILSLFFVFSVVTAGVTNNRNILREFGLQGNVNDGVQRISQMTHEELLHQKFLLDILQDVNDQKVSEDIVQGPVSQYDQLINDQTRYNGVIDDLMANVLELSRNQQLLSKAETFTIANDEHVRQMVGLYRVLVRSCDWDTLQRNLIHARLHVNGVLLVNSLLLAIRDREDTQNLIMPGIHEILPELYLDEDVLRRAEDIHLNQLISTSETVSRKTQRPSLFQMIGINKLWNRNANGVDTLDRSELWMPWREMHNELAMRRIGGASAPMQITRRNDDDRIVLPVTLPSSSLRKEKEARLLTKDVGLQSFLQNLVNDLCLTRNEATLENRQRSSRAQFARVGLERNVGSMLESGIRVNQQQMEEQRLRDRTDGLINNDRISGDNDVISNPSRRQSGSTVNDNIRIRNENVWRSKSMKQSEEQLPTTTADDERLLHVNRNRQRAAAINQMHFRGEQSNEEWSSDNSAGVNDRWVRVDVGAGRRTNFMNSIIDPHVGLRNDYNAVDEEPHKSAQHMDMGTGMPMDWNRQMAMHRQRVRKISEIQGINGQNWREADQRRSDIDSDLPDIDIKDERLLHVGRRRLNQLRKSDKQNQSSGEDDRDDDDESQRRENQYWSEHQGWLNSMQQQQRISMQETVNDDRIMARGMGNIGIAVGQGYNRQSGVEHNDENVRNILTGQWGNDRARGEMNQWANNGKRQQVNRWYNERDADMQDVNHRIGSDIWRHRSARSVHGVDAVYAAGRQRLGQDDRVGELILHNLQQLVARINMEHIALNNQDYTTSRINNPRLANAADERLALRLNERRMNARQNRMLLDKVSDIENRLQAVIRSAGADQTKDGGDVNRLIGDVLIGRRMTNANVDLLNILSEVISQNGGLRGGIQQLSQISIDIEDPVVMHLLRRIVHMADVQRQRQLGGYRREDLEMDGIKINDVKVDKLRTYVDTDDVDLINALDASVMLKAKRNSVLSQRMVVARQQRLNHQTFTINIDVTSDRNQRAVVRTLLGPKEDVSDVASQLNEQRQNFVLLDTQIVDLRSGRNVIKRKSQDIDWTARDTTPLTEIYKRVMNALNGQLEISKDKVQGQNCHFPHRLLLPRGRPEGLPMQILVIITPVESEGGEEIEEANRVCGMGISNLNLDNQPLGFPLDRPIDDVQQAMSLPNVRLMDVQLFHSKQLVADDFF